MRYRYLSSSRPFLTQVLQKGPRPPGPPFQFYLGDMVWGAAEEYSPDAVLEPTVLLVQCELPGTESLEPGSGCDESWWPEDEESDTYRYEGWNGDWVQELIDKAERKESLGETEVVQWGKDWGLEVKLEVGLRAPAL